LLSPLKLHLNKTFALVSDYLLSPCGCQEIKQDCAISLMVTLSELWQDHCDHSQLTLLLMKTVENNCSWANKTFLNVHIDFDVRLMTQPCFMFYGCSYTPSQSAGATRVAVR